MKGDSIDIEVIIMKNKVLLIFFVSFIVIGVGAAIFFLSKLSISETEEVIVEETEYFRITHYDFQYYYSICDKKHRIIKTEGPFVKKPDITLTEDELLQITIQAGTGIGTQWGYFYDINKNKFSAIFQSIYDENNKKVAYGSLNKVIVADIFDDNKYYQEFSSFEKPFSSVAVPIIGAEFAEDGNSLEVTYLSGGSYEVITEIKEL